MFGRTIESNSFNLHSVHKLLLSLAFDNTKYMVLVACWQSLVLVMRKLFNLVKVIPRYLYSFTFSKIVFPIIKVCL